MRASEFREMTAENLQTRLQETRRELFNLRQQWYAGSLQDQNRLKAVRKDIARILTILREREIAGEIDDKGAAE
ncbi:MAG: 50S ribosomal protein L29 [Anaerolineae bacterium]|nr:50S ribosomal protein L29 [Anaerolineae bacterium]